MANGRYYPIDVFSNVPFVYYNSLLEGPRTYPLNSETPEWVQSKRGSTLMENTGRKAYNFLKHEGLNKPTFSITNRILSALKFLENAANIERANEVAFLQSKLKQLPLTNIKEFDPNDPQFDYVGFIEYLNSAIRGYDEYKTALIEEKKRIQAYSEGLKKYEQKCREFQKKHHSNASLSKQKRAEFMYESGLTSAVIYTATGRRNEGVFNQTQTTSRISQSITGLFKNNSFMSQIVNFVVEKYGAQLFNYKNNKGEFELNPARTAIFIKELTNWIYEHGVIQEITEAIWEGAANIQLSDDKRLSLTPSLQVELDNMFNSMLANPYLGETLDSIAKQYNLGAGENVKSSTIKARTTRFRTKMRAAYEREKANNRLETTKKGIVIKFDTWMKRLGLTNDKIRSIVTAADTISLQVHYESETDTASLLANSGAFSTIGTKNLATDVLGTVGMLTVDINFNDNKLQKKMTEMTKSIQQNQMKMVQQMSQVDSTKDLIKNSEIVKAAQEEQIKLIDEELREITKTQQGSKELLLALRTHTSVKDYATIGVKTKEFSGVSLGSTLDAQLTRIATLASSAGIDAIDSNDTFWLKTTLINMAPGLLGDVTSNRTQLEHYFSILLMFLMFDDNLTWLEDINNGTFRKGGISNLHLYRLNTVFVPQSYILTNLHQALYKLYTDVANAEKNPTDFVHVQIINKYKPVDSFYTGEINPDEWSAEAQYAISQTRITLHFMRNFIALFESLNKLLQS